MIIDLETPRLILRRLTLEDVGLLYDLDRDPEVTRYTSAQGQPPDYHQIRDQTLPHMLSYYRLYPGYGFWAALERSSGEFIGWFHFRPDRQEMGATELGYRLKRSAWGQGFATEGSRALILRGFTQLETARVVATAMEANRGSIRVMEKVGLHLEERFIHAATQTQAVKYGLNRQDFDPTIYPVDSLRGSRGSI